MKTYIFFYIFTRYLNNLRPSQHLFRGSKVIRVGNIPNFQNRKIPTNRVNLDEKISVEKRSRVYVARLVYVRPIHRRGLLPFCVHVCVRSRVCVARKRLRPAGLLLQ